MIMSPKRGAILPGFKGGSNGKGGHIDDEPRGNKATKCDTTLLLC